MECNLLDIISFSPIFSLTSLEKEVILLNELDENICTVINKDHCATRTSPRNKFVIKIKCINTSENFSPPKKRTRVGEDIYFANIPEAD